MLAGTIHGVGIRGGYREGGIRIPATLLRTTAGSGSVMVDVT